MNNYYFCMPDKSAFLKINENTLASLDVAKETSMFTEEPLHYTAEELNEMLKGWHVSTEKEWSFQIARQCEKLLKHVRIES